MAKIEEKSTAPEGYDYTNTEEKKSGYYEDAFPVWQHVRKIQEDYARLLKERKSLEIKLQAQYKQNAKMKDEIFKLNNALDEFKEFTEKVKTWKHGLD